MPIYLFSSVVMISLISFILDMPNLQSIDIGYSSLRYPSSIIFESEEMELMIRLDLPKLQSIRLGRYVLAGSSSNENSLIMKSSELIELMMRLAFIIISTRI